MNKKNVFKLVVVGLGGYIIGYHVGDWRWSNKKMQTAYDLLITLGTLNSDLVSWTLDQADLIREDPHEFLDKYIERVQFITIASDAMDDD